MIDDLITLLVILISALLIFNVGFFCGCLYVSRKRERNDKKPDRTDLHF